MQPLRTLLGLPRTAARGFASSARRRADQPGPSAPSAASAPSSASSTTAAPASSSAPAPASQFSNLPSVAELLKLPPSTRPHPRPGPDAAALRASLADAFKPNTNIDYSAQPASRGGSGSSGGAGASAWWRNRSRGALPEYGAPVLPPTPYSGRSIDVVFSNVSAAYRSLNARLSRNRIKRELKLGEYYEKPSDKRRRLEMERHRRRFQELVGWVAWGNVDRGC